MPNPKKKDSLKALQGTARKDRAEKKPKTNKAGAVALPAMGDGKSPVPRPPSDLPEVAKTAWNLALEFLPEGQVTPENFSLLERWARNYALCRKLQDTVEKKGVVIEAFDSNGNEVLKESPYFTAMVKIQSQVGWCEKQLGFTPATRAHVQNGLPENDTAEVNEFDDF